MAMIEIERGDAQSRVIAEQNDRFRMSWGADGTVPGRMAMTSGIAALGAVAILRLVAAVRAFAEFSEDNDPWGQRDFGIVAVEQGARRSGSTGRSISTTPTTPSARKRRRIRSGRGAC